MSLNFLKSGKHAHEQIDRANAETELRKQQAEERKKNPQARRFWMPEEAETQITFLDGNLMEEGGLLDAVSFWEHQVKLNGNFQNWFPCTKDDDACPICADGEKPSLVTLFTVIDHGSYEDKNGNLHQNEIKMYACKRLTFKMLQKMATKRDGLAGAKFDVSRTGDKAANVGSNFEFVDKTPLDKIAGKYGLDPDVVKPIEYSEAIKYLPSEKLRELGFGSSTNSVGKTDIPSGKSAGDWTGKVPDTEDYGDEL